MEELIKKLKLQLQTLQLQLQVLLLKKKLTIPNLPKPQYIVLHHGAGNWGFSQVNESHKNKWGFKSSLGYYIGYHKFIGYDGKMYVGRQDNEEGAHTVEASRPGFWNKHSIGICLQGNFEIELPTDAQLNTLKKELDKYDIPIKAHREISATLCPGKYLWEWLLTYR